MLKVSIIIPIYNRAHTLARTLDSFLKQTNTNWECILVDDYSTDTSVDIIRSFVEKDVRFKYCKNIHTKGAQGARNTGILHAQYDWVCLFDSDDYAYPTFLEHFHFIPEPLDRRAAHKYAAFQGISRFAADSPCRGGQQPVLARNGRAAGIHQHKAPGPVGVFDRARLHASLTEQ